MTSNRLGAALAVALFANQRDDGGFDLDGAGESFAAAVIAFRLRKRPVHGRPLRMPADRRCFDVVQRVCERNDVLVTELRKRSKWPEVRMVRDEAIWEMRRLSPPVSYPMAARAVGLKDHTSAMEAEKRHRARVSVPSPQPSMAGAGGVVPTADALPPALPAPASTSSEK